MKFLQRCIVIFVIALCGSVSAQTTVCNGDSVVLALEGYNEGNTVWQQSSDRATWSIASGAAYKDSLVVTAINTYYYRAVVTDGTCAPIYSDTVMITVRAAPTPPTANPASGITLLSFIANWTPSEGATTYYLDVAIDNGFTSFVNGYNNHRVNKTSDTVTGIFCNTTYYYRVRAYGDSCGITSTSSNMISVLTSACPAECTVKSTCSGNITDTRDNNIYKTIQIGTQCWMAQNLNVGAYVTGPTRQTPGLDNQDTSIEKYCYGDNVNTCATYGGLYLWDEMMAYGLGVTDGAGPQGICPAGWHLPTHNEWICLEKTLGGTTIAGGKLKDTTLWNIPNIGATNSSGFTALPAGTRDYVGTFSNVNNFTYFWAATDFGGGFAWSHSMSNNSASVTSGSSYPKELNGYSVRCVKD